MEKTEKKINLDNLAQKIYLFLALSYVLVIPIVTVLTCILKVRLYTLFIWHLLTLFISVLTITMFIIENLMNKHKLKKFKFNKCELIFFGLFFIWMIVSTFLSSNLALSMFGDEYRGNGLIQFISYIGYAMLGISLNKKNRIIVLRSICYVSFIMAIISLCGGRLYNIVFPAYTEYSGIFHHFNHYGYYLVYCIIISIFLIFSDNQKISKIADFIIYLTLICMLIVNNTFGCYLAILFSLFLLFFYCLKKKILIKYLFIIVPFILFSLFIKVDNEYVVYSNFKSLTYDLGIIKNEIKSDIDNGNVSIDDNQQLMYVGTGRGELWLYGIEFAKQKPIFGYGLDNLGEQYYNKNVGNDMPHNLIINLCATVGVPGMLFYMIAVLIVLIKGLKNYNKNDHITNLTYFVIIGHLVSSMFGNTMYYVTPYYVIILGMGMYALNEKEKLQDS